MSVCYWPVTQPELYSADKFPGFMFIKPLGKKNRIYGFPVLEYPGLIKARKVEIIVLNSV